MIETGVYRGGTNPIVDRAISARAQLTAFLRQPSSEKCSGVDTARRLQALASGTAQDA
jgi:flagellar biosynthesis/type III secretory pathway ATPase